MSTITPALAEKPAAPEKLDPLPEQHENAISRIDTVQDNAAHGWETDLDELPKGYYLSRFFLGTFFAVGFSIWAGTAAFGYAAAILPVINEDLGPDDRYVWISLVYNTCLAVFLSPVGRLSDIFGRRYFFIAGAVLAVIGSVVCATADSILVLIGGNVLLGVATSTQLSFHFVIGELVPVRHRYAAVAAVYMFTIPGSGFGPAISWAFVTRYPSVGWRGTYWLLLAINVLALIAWVLFYFPPTFHQKHKTDIDSKMYWVKNFDYGGTFLFAAGFVVFLLGLSWGGTIYAWNSAATIAPIVVGAVVLIVFVLYEIYVPLKEPLLPMHLFANVRWTAAVMLLGLGAGVYYAFSIVWPTQVTVLYGSSSDQMQIGYDSVLVGTGIIFGQVVAGFFAAQIGKQKWQCVVAFLVGGTFLGCAAVGTPDNKETVMALIFLGCFFIGWNESICLTNSTILVKDQREIGIAGGMAGSCRSAISAILTAVYTSILSNRVPAEVAERVPSALTNAGLPSSSVSGFLAALTTGSQSAFESVAGVTDQIIAVGSRAYKEANADAYRTVYLSTIAFSGLALILTWYAPNTDELMTDKVAATLNRQDTVATKDIEMAHQDE